MCDIQYNVFVFGLFLGAAVMRLKRKGTTGRCEP